MLGKGIGTGFFFLLSGSLQALLSFGGSAGLGLSGLGAAANGGIKDTLHQRTCSATIPSGFAHTLDDLLLGLVDTLGNQVLGNVGCSFLSGFFTTGSGGAAYIGQHTVGCGSAKAVNDTEYG